MNALVSKHILFLTLAISFQTLFAIEAKNQHKSELPVGMRSIVPNFSSPSSLSGIISFNSH